MEDSRQKTLQELETLKALVQQLEKDVAAKDEECNLKYQDEFLPFIRQGRDVCKKGRQAKREDMAKQVREHAAFAD